MLGLKSRLFTDIYYAMFVTHLSLFRSKEYAWLIVTMGIYYAVPVIQLVLLLQSFSTVDGNRNRFQLEFK